MDVDLERDWSPLADGRGEKEQPGSVIGGYAAGVVPRPPSTRHLASSSAKNLSDFANTVGTQSLAGSAGLAPASLFSFLGKSCTGKPPRSQSSSPEDKDGEAQVPGTSLMKKGFLDHGASGSGSDSDVPLGLWGGCLAVGGRGRQARRIPLRAARPNRQRMDRSRPRAGERQADVKVPLLMESPIMSSQDCEKERLMEELERYKMAMEDPLLQRQRASPSAARQPASSAPPPRCRPGDGPLGSLRRLDEDAALTSAVPGLPDHPHTVAAAAAARKATAAQACRSGAPLEVPQTRLASGGYRSASADAAPPKFAPFSFAPSSSPAPHWSPSAWSPEAGYCSQSFWASPSSNGTGFSPAGSVSSGATSGYLDGKKIIEAQSVVADMFAPRHAAPRRGAGHLRPQRVTRRHGSEPPLALATWQATASSYGAPARGKNISSAAPVPAVQHQRSDNRSWTLPDNPQRLQIPRVITTPPVPAQHRQQRDTGAAVPKAGLAASCDVLPRGSPGLKPLNGCLNRDRNAVSCDRLPGLPPPLLAGALEAALGWDARAGSQLAVPFLGDAVKKAALPYPPQLSPSAASPLTPSRWQQRRANKQSRVNSEPPSSGFGHSELDVDFCSLLEEALVGQHFDAGVWSGGGSAQAARRSVPTAQSTDTLEEPCPEEPPCPANFRAEDQARGAPPATVKAEPVPPACHADQDFCSLLQAALSVESPTCGVKVARCSSSVSTVETSVVEPCPEYMTPCGSRCVSTDAGSAAPLSSSGGSVSPMPAAAPLEEAIPLPLMKPSPERRAFQLQPPQFSFSDSDGRMALPGQAAAVATDFV